MAYRHHGGPLRYAAARAYSSIQEDKLGQLVGSHGGSIGSLCPSPPSKTGPRERGKKGEGRIEGEYLDRALDTFSGYMAADDEVYHGPCCVLSIVDNPACLKTV